MKILATLATLAVAVPTAATADALPKHVQDMECLVGTWKATGTLKMGADTVKVKATWDCKRTSAKFGVLCHLRLTGIPGLAEYAETDLFGYDPHSNTYHWFSVTSTGDTHDHVAQVPTSNKITFVYTGTQEGKPLKEQIDLVLAKDSKSFVLRSETFVAGTSTARFDMIAKK